MAIELPSTAIEVEERSKTDVKRSLPGGNPFEKNSVMGAIVTGNANRVFDFYAQLDILQGALMPDTSIDEFLQRWAAIYGIQIIAATQATGSAIAGGTLASSIPIGTLFSSSGGEIYESTATVAITNKNISVSSITRSGNIATVVCDSDHGLATNIEPTIAGAGESQYNLSSLTIISIVDSTTFTYEVSGSPATPASGAITVDFDSATVPIESQGFQSSGEDVNVNLENGEEINLQSPIVGVNSTLAIGAVPVGGGTDQETNSQLRARFLNRIQNPIAHFNVNSIIDKAREVAGVTRVFVQEVTPERGQVTIYFMRDNDTDPIPDAGEVTTVKNKILEIKPANTADEDVFVYAPTAVPTPITFTSLSPNTETMRLAITANLQQFFEEETKVGVDVQRDAYRAAIQNTIDTENGDRVLDFTLSTPTSDIAVNVGEIATLSTITYL